MFLVHPFWSEDFCQGFWKVNGAKAPPTIRIDVISAPVSTSDWSKLILVPRLNSSCSRGGIRKASCLHDIIPKTSKVVKTTIPGHSTRSVKFVLELVGFFKKWTTQLFWYLQDSGSNLLHRLYSKWTIFTPSPPSLRSLHARNWTTKYQKMQGCFKAFPFKHCYFVYLFQISGRVALELVC